MTDYLAELLLDLPGKDPEINSLVHVASDKKITGFIGVITQAMVYEGRTLRAALGNSLAVDPEARDPMAAALLLRGFMKGPQDITLSDRANATSLAMWRSLRGHTLPLYSLDWLRVLRPAGYAAALAAQRGRHIGLLAPVARGIDGLIARRSGVGGSKWALAPSKSPAGLSVEDVDDDALLKVIPGLVAHVPLHPMWTPEGLRQVLAQAAQKSEVGKMARQVVRTKSGGLLGAYLYHVRPGAIARTLHVLPAKGQTDIVLDCLLADASARGAVAIGGRAQPDLIEPLMDRRASFASPQRCLFDARDKALLTPMLNGQAVITGLVGEYWTRLNGDGLR